MRFRAEVFGREAERLHSLATASRPKTSADRKSTRLNSSHLVISYAVFCLKKTKTSNNLVYPAISRRETAAHDPIPWRVQVAFTQHPITSSVSTCFSTLAWLPNTRVRSNFCP